MSIIEWYGPCHCTDNCASIPLCEYLPYQEHYRSAFGIHSIRHTCNPGKVSVPFLYMWVCCAYVLKQNVITTCLLQRVSRLYSQLCDYVNTRQYLHRTAHDKTTFTVIKVMCRARGTLQYLSLRVGTYNGAPQKINLTHSYSM